MISLFPKTCIGCGRIHSASLCSFCIQEWKTKSFQIRKFLSQRGDEIIACCHYNSLGGKIVRSFKYGKRFELLPLISEALFLAVTEINENEFSFILPTPQSLRKVISRGFHPVEMMTKEVSKKTLIPFNANVLHRKWEWFEKDQAGLNRIKRLNQLSRSFYVTRKKTWEGNRSIVLIDDVATTGTTLFRCKEAIHQHYPDWQVNMVVFAHG